jgi:hypothetical protein
LYNTNEGPTIFGDLRNDGAKFVAWFPFRRRVHRLGTVIEAFAQEMSPRIVEFIAEWENSTRWPKDLNALDYKYEKHDTDDDPLCIAAEAAARSPLFKTTINISLAIPEGLAPISRHGARRAGHRNRGIEMRGSPTPSPNALSNWHPDLRGSEVWLW